MGNGWSSRSCQHPSNSAHSVERHGRSIPIEAEPRNGKAWYLAGVLRSLDGDKPGALAALEKAVTFSPEDSGAQTNLGRLLLDLGRPAEAVRPLKRAAALLPEDVGLWRTLARAARSAPCRGYRECDALARLHGRRDRRR